MAAEAETESSMPPTASERRLRKQFAGARSCERRARRNRPAMNVLL
jgi:hypothetical protein